MSLSTSSFASGVRTLSAHGETADSLAGAILAAANAVECSLILLFLSDPHLDPGALAARLCNDLPRCKIAGCTTAGEIGPVGIGDGSVLAVLFPAAHFAVSTLSIERISATPMTDIAEAVTTLRQRHLDATDTRHAATVAICMIDGLSYAEEAVTSAVFWGLGDIPLIGGSAGDRLEFAETRVIANGSAHTDRAVIALMSTDIPFEVFKSDNFVPVDRKFVVTSSDPDRRIVRELDAAPAASEYAAAIGKSLDEMSAPGFASHPLVLKVGGEHYCRAIRGITEDGGLSFACAIDDGVVLMLAEARGMVESTRVTFERLEDKLGGIDFVLGFDCAYRRIDAENRQVIRRMSELYRKYNVVGFGTYGEQFQSMHLNQTMTGIAFGRRTGNTVKAAAE